MMDIEILFGIGFGTTVLSAICTSVWFYRKRTLENKGLKVVAIEFSPPENVEQETIRKVISIFSKSRGILEHGLRG
ncbi:MAG: hypothetical protein ACPGWR_31280 [Ardenticatenaceae bacterium]